ncbi:MAG: bifunctional methylenetetrahydrofolate dehydrogenase/methenyltetrahydrofolate cyclohydrolase, partial [Rhodospirillaceae bacterium]|nr:bifunctional methylenetetrahydrofolate dehydrogenase/methenyltetrahydrofolate cyclohydrolase [Rhodospirillaceae bacterium]
MSEATIIDGKAFAEGLRGRIGTEVARIKADHDLTPGLAVVLVGEDPASQVYVRNKGKQTLEAGMNSFEHKLDADTPEESLLSLIDTLNKDSSVNGILVQLPLPGHINEAKVLASIAPAKDVDGFHLINVGKLTTGDKSAMVPCTPLGCIM